MEDLTKQQIVLLTLLVSFMTSIATGIVTVSLMGQAPQGVTQTINRVVERTVEKVIPNQPTQTTAKNPSTTTTVVKETDLAVDAVSSNEKSFVRIYEKPRGAAISQNAFSRFGIVISKTGSIMTDGNVISNYMDYTATFSDGKSYSILPDQSDAVTGLEIFKVVKDGKDPYAFVPASFGDSDNLKLGQTVISLAGKDSDSVALGIVSNLVWISVATSTNSSNATTTPEIKKINQGIFTDISAKEELYGNPLITLSGDIVGMRTHSSTLNKGDYLPSNAIKNLIASLSTAK